jgi:hypothetical protein
VRDGVAVTVGVVEVELGVGNGVVEVELGVGVI